ncbi:MAG: hypothetical protein ABIM88_05135 [candidate division WOR-3 bacterium]
MFYCLSFVVISQTSIPEVKLSVTEEKPETASVIPKNAAKPINSLKIWPQDYLMPTRCFTVPTAKVLPSRTFWLNGGVSLGSAEAFQEAGIFQGVLGLGLGDVVEGRFMIAGVLTNLSTGSIVAPTTSFKLQLSRQTKKVPVFTALELRTTPGYHYSFQAGGNKYGVKYGFLYGVMGRDMGSWSVHLGGSVSDYRIMTVERDTAYAKDSSLTQVIFYGGTIGLQKFMANNTAMVFEGQLVPKVCFPTDTSSASLEAVYALLGGVRYFFTPNWCIDAGLFYAGEVDNPTPAIADMMVYSNLHFLFTWDALTRFFVPQEW